MNFLKKRHEFRLTFSLYLCVFGFDHSHDFSAQKSLRLPFHVSLKCFGAAIHFRGSGWMKFSFVLSLTLRGRLKPSLSDASKSSESKSFSDNEPPTRFTRIGSSRFCTKMKKYLFDFLYFFSWNIYQIWLRNIAFIVFFIG